MRAAPTTFQMSSIVVYVNKTKACDNIIVHPVKVQFQQLIVEAVHQLEL